VGCLSEGAGFLGNPQTCRIGLAHKPAGLGLLTNLPDLGDPAGLALGETTKQQKPCTRR